MKAPDLVDLKEARKRLQSTLSPTPLVPAHTLIQAFGANHQMKLENLQPTGSFKVRGAVNRLHRAEARVVTASSGNHAAALAWAGRRLGIEVIAYIPENTPEQKQRRLRALGANVMIGGRGYDEVEQCAQTFAKQKGLPWISPFSDAAIIAGSGTMALEIIDQVGPPGTVLVPVGGGGLVSGLAIGLRACAPKTRIIGIQPAASCPMVVAYYARRLASVSHLPTLSDATAGGISQFTLTQVVKHVDDVIAVGEQAIADAIHHLLTEENIVVEGAGALSVAACLCFALPKNLPEPIVHIMSGGNIDPHRLIEILHRPL